jgi:hypothetical protein
MVVAIVAIVAMAAVGITALVAGSSPSSSVATTTKVTVVQTTAAPTTTPTTAAVTTTTAATIANFIGTWITHDGELVVAPNGGGTISVPGLTLRACNQSAQIQVSPVATTTAEATITSIAAPSCQDSPPGFNPSGAGGVNEDLGVGSTIMLTFAPPGVQTSMGVSYCDPAHEAQGVCGA